MPDFNLTCASSRSTLGTQMWLYECCPSEQKVPSGPFLERWNIECDKGSNCMGSNQLDTQLKETWGLRAARHMALPDSVDVQWTNPASWNCSFFSFFTVKRWTGVLGMMGRLLFKFRTLPWGNKLTQTLGLSPLLNCPPLLYGKRILKGWQRKTVSVYQPWEALE